MGMTRTDAIEYLSQQFGELEELTGVTPDEDGYGQAITDALLKLSIDYDNATDPSYEVTANILAYRKLLSYYALVRFKSKLAPDESYGISGEGVNTKRSVAFAQVHMVLQDLVLELAGMGIIVQQIPGVKSGYRVRTFNTDVFEPDNRGDRV